MFEGLAVAVKELGELESWAMADDELSEVLVELARLRRCFEAAQARLAADWNARRIWAGDGAKAGSSSICSHQRRADALVEMARRSSRSDAAGRPARPLLTVVLGADDFRHLCELASGTVISPAALLPSLDDAAIEWILFDGSPSRPIEVSSKRLFKGALRRVIEVRDRRCYHGYCDEPASNCQVDHIQPWTAGGITTHWNGRVACGHHNRLRNQRPPPAEDEDEDDDDTQEGDIDYPVQE